MTLEDKSDDNEGIAAIHSALDYGMGHNEMLIGRAPSIAAAKLRSP